MKLDDLKDRVRKIASEHRCQRVAEEKLGCIHPECVAVFAYEQKLIMLLDNLTRCHACNGTGKTELSL